MSKRTKNLLIELGPLLMVILAITIAIIYILAQVYKCRYGVAYWTIEYPCLLCKAQWVTVCRMGP